MKWFVDVPKVYLHRDVVDFRKSINGLAVIVEQQMNLRACDDAVFVFCNRRRDKLKILYWDKSGFVLWYKRLEESKFKWPRKDVQHTITLTSEQLNWLLDGYDITVMKQHKPLHFKSFS